MKKAFLTTVIMSVLMLTTSLTFAQSNPTTPTQKAEYTYAYVAVQGKVFSKKLKVLVDFGDSPQQIKDGETYSDFLTNKKSYAAVLNHMVEQGFELVNTLELTGIYQGSGGTAGIVFIMKKKN